MGERELQRWITVSLKHDQKQQVENAALEIGGHLLSGEPKEAWCVTRGVTVRTPQHHDFDHQAIVAVLKGGSLKKMERYRQNSKRFPLKLPSGPKTQAEGMFKRLNAEVGKPAAHGHAYNS